MATGRIKRGSSGFRLETTSVILITGEMRSGTTMLIELFDILGFSTTTSKKEKLYYMEFLNYYKDRFDEITEFPEVIKHGSTLCYKLKNLIDRFDWEVEHMFYMLNDMDNLIAKKLYPNPEIKARRSNQRIYHKSIGLSFKEWNSMSSEEIEEEVKNFYYKRVGAAIYGAVECGVPITTIHYQRFCKDVKYAYEKLLPVLDRVTKEAFTKAHEDHVDLDKVKPWAEKRIK